MNRLPTFQMDVYEYREFPDRRLWVEVLYCAIHDVLHFLEDALPVRHKYDLARRAQTWIHSKNRTRYSFLWCCEVVFSSEYEQTAIRTIKAMTNHPLKLFWDYSNGVELDESSLNALNDALELKRQMILQCATEYDKPSLDDGNHISGVLERYDAYISSKSLPSVAAAGQSNRRSPKGLYEDVRCLRRYRSTSKA